VDDDRVDADILEQDDVQCESLLQPLLLHGVPAVLDDHGPAEVMPDVGQGLEEDLRFGDLGLHLRFLVGTKSEYRNPKHLKRGKHETRISKSETPQEGKARNSNIEIRNTSRGESTKLEYRNSKHFKRGFAFRNFGFSEASLRFEFRYSSFVLS
jgi:hypothetical protein